MDSKEFVEHINKLRRDNKNKWYFFTGIANGKKVQLKGFGTWLQVFKLDGLDNAACADISVKRFKEVILSSIEHKRI